MNETIQYYITIPSAGWVLFKSVILPIILVILTALGVYFVFRERRRVSERFVLFYILLVSEFILVIALSNVLTAEFMYYTAIATELQKDYLVNLFTVGLYGLTFYRYVIYILIILMVVLPFLWLIYIWYSIRKR